MTAKLTNAMLNEIAAHPGQAIPLVDDEGNRYFLVEEASLLHLQGLAVEQNAESQRRLKALIQEGIDSDHVSAKEGEARIDELLQSYRDKIA